MCKGYFLYTEFDLYCSHTGPQPKYLFDEKYPKNQFNIIKIHIKRFQKQVSIKSDLLLFGRY